MWPVWDHLDVTRCLPWEKLSRLICWKSRSSLWERNCSDTKFYNSFFSKQQEKGTDGCNLPVSSIIFGSSCSCNSSDTNQYPALSSCYRELLVVTGGYSWNSILARTEALNMTAEEGNRWRRLAPLLKPRYLHACSPVQLGTEVRSLLNLGKLMSNQPKYLWTANMFQGWGTGGRGLLFHLSQLHWGLQVCRCIIHSASLLVLPAGKFIFALF